MWLTVITFSLVFVFALRTALRGQRPIESPEELAAELEEVAELDDVAGPDPPAGEPTT